MKGLICGIIAMLMSTQVQALTVSVEPENARLDESLRLIITDDQSKMQAIPNLTGLQTDFTILGTERSINYSNLNGQISTVSQWIVTLRAKRAGTLVIPPIPLGLQTTKPLSVIVTPSSQQQTQSLQTITDKTEKDIKLIAEVDNKAPYINQQTVLTVKIFNSRRLLDTHYQPPEADNALLIPLGDSRSYQHTEGGKIYIVEEQPYAIFPQKSGTLTIKPPIFTALTYDVTPTQIKTETKPLVLTVQPAPLNIPNAAWLPAKNLSLSENYEQSDTLLNQGSTLVRRITLETTGIPGQFLQANPALHFENKQQFSVYPEPAKEQSIVRDGNVVGKLDLKITYLLNKAGKITIPELRIPWFNTVTGKQEMAVLPPKLLEITAVAGALSNTEQAHPVSPVVPAGPIAIEKQSWWAWLITGFFALAWLITVILWLKQKQTVLQKKHYQKSLARLQKACEANDPKTARDALIHWAMLHWPEASLLNLKDLMPLAHDLALKKQLHYLSQVLYSKEQIRWTGDALWQAISQVIKIKPRHQDRQKTALPPMHLLGK